ncbi:MAG: hypothetical protein JHD35_20570 [Sphingopyxis sp.]|nr:hypothetical protein [Sphingopyxis sp.]
MFLWHGGQKQFDYLMGQSKPEISSVENFIANLKQRKKFCDTRQISYLHVVYPSKPVIMTEFTPDNIRDRVKSLYLSCYADKVKSSQFVNVIYPRMLLLEQKSKHAVFKRCDTHMSDIGNVIISREILRCIGYQHDPLSFLVEESRPANGDLASMANIVGDTTEICLFTKYKSETMWDNRVFLKGNTDNVVIMFNPRSATKMRLLALGDSFLKDSLKPLSTFYRDILFVRSDTFQPDLVDLFGPDTVLTSNAERYLSKVNRDDDSESIVTRLYGRKDYVPTESFVAALRAQLSYLYYPNRYHIWSSQAEALAFTGLGIGELGGDIIFQPTNGGTFEATGRDPQMLFPKTAIEPHRHYRLKVSMQCSVPGRAQLFESEPSTNKPNFSETRSQTLEVNEGINSLEFDLPPTARGRQLRFDPINRAGQLRILSMELVAV